MIKKQSTRILSAQPQESLHILESTVAQHFNWRILTGGSVDQARFMIEKQVRFDLVRGLPMVATY